MIQLLKSLSLNNHIFFVTLVFISFIFLSFREPDKSPSFNKCECKTAPSDLNLSTGKDQVALLVIRDAFKSLKPEINQYKSDVEANFPVQLHIIKGSWVKPEEVRATIIELYNKKNISGVVLVGAIPMHRFFMHDFPNPNPLFYEAFDLKFVDNNGDGISDAYIGRPDLRVWVANLRGVENDADQGIEILKTFFQKTHKYYSGKVKIEKKVLAVTASDWPEGANDFAAQYGRPIFGPDNVITLGPERTTKENILSVFKDNNFSMFYIQVHSGASSQRTANGILYSKEIAEINTGALFTINHGCSTCNWEKAALESERNTGMSWVFGKSIGEAIVCNVRTGMVYGQDSIYSRIMDGDYLGKAYFEGKKAAELEMFNEYPSGEIVSGVTFIGNPFIYIQKKK